MATVLDTFITRFGFQTDKTGLDQAEKGISNFKSSAIKVAAAVGSILGGGFFLNAVATAADETIKWADANGLAIESLGQLEFATQRQGGTVDGLRASLSNLNKSIGEVERGTGRAKLAFEDYGLTVKNSNGTTKTADELLVDLNKKFATLSRAQQFDLAMKMGIDKGTIRLLQTAPDEIARLRMEASRLGVLSRRDAVRAAKFVDGMTNMGQAMQAIKFEIGGFLFEPLKKFFDLVTDGIVFFKQHKEIILELIGIIGLVGAAYTAMGVKALVAWLLALGPPFLFIAVLGLVGVALAILSQDFKAFFKGQDSAIGDLVKKWPMLGDVIYFVRDSFVQTWKDMVEGFKIMHGWLKKMGDEMINFVFDPGQGADDFLQLLKDIHWWLGKIGDEWIDIALNPLDSISKLIEDIPGFNTLKDLIVNPGLLLPGLPPVGAPSPASAIAAQGSSSIRKPTQLRTGDINIDARGGDSKEIAAKTADALKEQLQNTVEDFDSGIKE